MIHLLQVNPSSGEPIYQQLTEQIKRLIAAGVLLEGDELPSVRQVASSLSINPMTVSRSYQMLLSEGLVLRPRGQKMRVAQAQASDEQARSEMLQPLVDDLVKQAKQLQLELSAVQSLLAQSWNSVTIPSDDADN
ncbi:GntR family transcriptional regulator [Motilimonas cestriensis]|uniref:GntR family transcriptional regulator n=1 Tax=Motilimonas cestriensis TaxID=2742685 RepID=A0ABS8W6I4_9GAMM|nr:GntR family transcriptional regulator [Motilimonas cestriensis]MCE2594601.1 GntR family transcriptional regulator [Motilimonas cestriensis]